MNTRTLISRRRIGAAAALLFAAACCHIQVTDLKDPGSTLRLANATDGGAPEPQCPPDCFCDTKGPAGCPALKCAAVDMANSCQNGGLCVYKATGSASCPCYVGQPDRDQPACVSKKETCVEVNATDNQWVCNPSDCEPNTIACTDTNVARHTCTAEKHWGPDEQCPPNQVCTGGNCVCGCPDGQMRCEGTTRVTCANCAEVRTPAPPGASCDNGNFLCACNDGATRCDGGALQQCSHCAWQNQPCAPPNFCSNGACHPPCGDLSEACCDGNVCHEGVCSGGACKQRCTDTLDTIFSQRISEKGDFGTREDKSFGNPTCPPGKHMNQCSAFRTDTVNPTHAHCEVTSQNGCQCNVHLGAIAGATINCQIDVSLVSNGCVE